MAVKKKVLKLDKAKYYQILVNSTFNNTRVSLFHNGNLIRGMTAGSIGYKGTQKPTPYVAEKLTVVFMEEIIQAGARNFHVDIKGVGLGRTSAIRVIQEFINKSRDKNAITVDTIRDITPQAHNTVKIKK